MRFARRRTEEPEIGLTSLIDVVFLLLIFFMVTTSFVDEAGLSVALPEAGQAEAAPEPAAATVVVDAGNGIFVGGRRLRGPDALREALAGLATDARELRIRADGRASHRTVVTVMDAAAAAGFRRIDIAARPEPIEE